MYKLYKVNIIEQTIYIQTGSTGKRKKKQKQKKTCFQHFVLFDIVYRQTIQTLRLELLRSCACLLIIRRVYCTSIAYILENAKSFLFNSWFGGLSKVLVACIHNLFGFIYYIQLDSIVRTNYVEWLSAFSLPLLFCLFQNKRIFLLDLFFFSCLILVLRIHQSIYPVQFNSLFIPSSCVVVCCGRFGSVRGG